MNNLVNIYNKLVKDDEKLIPLGNLYPDLDFIEAIKSFLSESGSDFSKVLFAYVHGSFCRQERSKYSDIDLIIYTKDFRGDYIYDYQGHMLNLNFKPISMIGEIVSGSNILWNLGVHKNMQVIYDKDGYAEYFRNYLKQTFKDLRINPNLFINSFATEIRRVVEYRRKIIGFVEKHNLADNVIDKYTYYDLLNKYLFNFFSILGFFNDVYFPSEKNFYHHVSNVLYPPAEKQIKILMDELDNKEKLVNTVNNIYSYFVDQFESYLTADKVAHETN